MSEVDELMYLRGRVSGFYVGIYGGATEEEVGGSIFKPTPITQQGADKVENLDLSEVTWASSVIFFDAIKQAIDHADFTEAQKAEYGIA